MRAWATGPSAGAAFDNFIALDAGRGWYEKGNYFWRVGLYQQAADAYLAGVEAVADGAFSAESAFSAAQVTDFFVDDQTAIDLYQTYARNYPFDDNASRALHRAGWLAQQLGDETLAKVLWYETAEKYPNIRHGQAALVGLLPLDDTGEARALGEQINRWPSFYNARIHDILAGNEPFAPAAGLDLESATSFEARLSAESYLRTIAGVDAETDVSTLAPFITNNGHFQRGQRLWQLRELESARREFEFLRDIYSDNLLVSYQLALYFRQIGLYRSSIVAATTVINLTDDNVFTVPPFLASLAYPAYYDDLIVPLANEYDYDPLVQFALVRQESLYESFATSTAVAQGLAQVIPDTGAYINNKLQWPPNYETSDLYKPYVGLRFGGFYLAEQIALFDGTVHAALAAYNGGPGNSLRWYNAAGTDIDAFVETVNFPESRLYVERIYFGHAVYKHLYGGG